MIKLTTLALASLFLVASGTAASAEASHELHLQFRIGCSADDAAALFGDPGKSEEVAEGLTERVWEFGAPTPLGERRTVRVHCEGPGRRNGRPGLLDLAELF